MSDLARPDGIGGLFFRAADPEALAAWYAEHLGIHEVPSSYDAPCWEPLAGPTVFAPFAADTEYFGRPEQQWMLNLRTRDLDTLVERLRAAGIEVDVEAEAYPNGRFARLQDPEGNPIQLWQPEKVGLPRGPIARTSQWIHRPALEVYAALIEAGQLTRFWLAEADGDLHADATVRWTFHVPGAEATVTCTRFEPPHHLAYRFEDGSHVTVELSRFEGGTVVDLSHEGFHGHLDPVAAAIDSTKGFTLMLSALKLLLEGHDAHRLVEDEAHHLASKKA